MIPPLSSSLFSPLLSIDRQIVYRLLTAVYFACYVAVVRYQSKTAKTILDTILSIQPKDSSSGVGGETREATVYRLCDDMLGKLPSDYIPFDVRTRLQARRSMG